jgi:hypothetical protein
MKTSEREFTGFVHDNGKLELDFEAAFRAYVKRFAGEEVTLTLQKKREKRSDRQNRAFWAALTPWAHELGYEPVELKNELLGLLWGYDEHTSKLTGEVRHVPRKGRSSKLTTQEMSELYEFMAVKAAETGYVIELADEFNERRRKERRRAGNKAA